MTEKRQSFAHAVPNRPLLPPGRVAAIRLGLAAAVLLVTSGCSSLRVEVDRDSTVPIPAGATWAWGPEPTPKRSDELDPRVNNSIIHGRVQRAVETVLAEKGFRQTDPARADFLVEYRVAVRDRREMVTQTVGSPVPYGFGGPGWAWGYYGPPVVTTREIRYTEGALLIDLVQQATGKLAFRAIGRESVTRDDGSAEAVHEVVTRLLRDLP
jgi:Domain of unknown function (DUF4136)